MLKLIESFAEVTFKFVPQSENWEAKELALIYSGIKIPEYTYVKFITVEKRSLSLMFKRQIDGRYQLEICTLDVTQSDWRYPIIKYLKKPLAKID